MGAVFGEQVRPLAITVKVPLSLTSQNPQVTANASFRNYTKLTQPIQE